VGLVSDQSNNHAIKVKEEHAKMEAEFEEGFLLVYIQLSEDLSSVKKVGIVHNLLDIPPQQGSVEDYGNPISVNEKEEGKEAVYGSLGYDVRVQSVAELNRVDIIALQVAIHYGKEDLQKQIHRID